MPSDVFRFKQFVVRQSDSAMKVGTDGVLLGAWSSASGRRILDVGTGTGLIALMLAQRAEANIIGVEIDRQAAHGAVVCKWLVWMYANIVLALPLTS